MRTHESYQLAGRLGAKTRWSKETFTARFWRRVDIRSKKACWNWKQSLTNSGYGKSSFGGKWFCGHKVAYILTFGPVPKGLCVLHTCDNPPCCNPAHLFLGTHKDNAADMRKKGRANTIKGEDCPWAKLTQDDVNEIRQLHTDGASQTKLAKLFGVGQWQISRIVNRKRWKG